MSAAEGDAGGGVAGVDDKQRCEWCEMSFSAKDPKSVVMHRDYHDLEWGRPVRDDDNKLFEMITLEGAQAGLSWATILKKRDSYRRAFDDFDIDKVAECNW
eukprot:TRINITY_DN273_c0_g1_i1.p3 TRINITY_DN273_c0_g1~~TRINITY_DN273_c0_g1_i1.p3  ORF type:complete len:101 (+),score=45.45 TRINITY_DN273_c0_g1_i1:48-350(+)